MNRTTHEIGPDHYCLHCGTHVDRVNGLYCEAFTGEAKAAVNRRHRSKVNLNLLFVFFLVAKYKSQMIASEMLGIQNASVCEHMKKLEADLGADLFDNPTRGIRLDLPGVELFDRIKTPMEALESYLIEEKRIKPSGRPEQTRLFP